MPLRAVIFDVDGTLVDNHEAHESSWLVWGGRHQIAIDHAFYMEHLYARSNERILRTLLGQQITDEEVRRWAEEKESIYRELYRPRMEPMPGLLACLKEIAAAGITCAVASNAERANVDMVIDGLGLRPRFRAVLAREDVKLGKPDPALFLGAARAAGAGPEECLVFEDSATGFEAARRAGMRCVAITSHSHPGAIPPGVLDTHRNFTTVRIRDLLHYY